MNFGYDRNAPNVFDENCEIINNYLGSELKVGADMIQELATLEEVVLVEPTIDPNNAQLLAHDKREANRKQNARRNLKLHNGRSATTLVYLLLPTQDNVTRKRSSACKTSSMGCRPRKTTLNLNSLMTSSLSLKDRKAPSMIRT